MKKQYEQPKAEKLEFDYEETVTASNGNTDKNYGHGCKKEHGNGNSCKNK